MWNFELVIHVDLRRMFRPWGESDKKNKDHEGISGDF